MKTIQRLLNRQTAIVASFLALSLVSIYAGVNAVTIKPIPSEPRLPEALHQAIYDAMNEQGLELSQDEINLIDEEVSTAIADYCTYNKKTSKLGFSAVEIAQSLNLPIKKQPQLVKRVENALVSIGQQPEYCLSSDPINDNPTAEARKGWEKYFNDTIALSADQQFMSLMSQYDYNPVHISWEDISRYENSVWGDRISDVGIWVRKDEKDLSSAELALSVRRDSNYQDKVLVVPAEQIKVHQKVNGSTVEKSLPQRLKELGLSSPTKDKNVIVSNQFAIVPVPQQGTRNWTSARADAKNPARVAFNFSIFPYGSTNYVITDVIEGSSEAIVGPGHHQLLYANINGQKAPFTASCAKERQDLLQLEATLKKQGMDVDVQRYYLIQIPIDKKAKGVILSNMGTPPSSRVYASAPMGAGSMMVEDEAVMYNGLGKTLAAKPAMEAVKKDKGLEKVAIGHGEAEGKYYAGSGFKGKRSVNEPVRVTVVYFVTPTGKVSQADMKDFAQTFKKWDTEAIWGGSFVVKSATGL